MAHSDDGRLPARLGSKDTCGDALEGLGGHQVDLVAHLGDVDLAVMDEQLGQGHDQVYNSKASGVHQGLPADPNPRPPLPYSRGP